MLVLGVLGRCVGSGGWLQVGGWLFWVILVLALVGWEKWVFWRVGPGLGGGGAWCWRVDCQCRFVYMRWAEEVGGKLLGRSMIPTAGGQELRDTFWVSNIIDRPQAASGSGRVVWGHLGS